MMNVLPDGGYLILMVMMSINASACYTVLMMIKKFSTKNENSEP